MGIEEYLGEMLSVKMYLYGSILMVNISMHNENLHN